MAKTTKPKRRKPKPRPTPWEAAGERARVHYQRLMEHPVPEFIAAWEYWSAELRITAEDVKRLQEQAGLSSRQGIGATTLRRWVRGESSPNLAGLAILTRLLLGEKANWYTDFIGRGRRVLKELRYYDELESRDE